MDLHDFLQRVLPAGRGQYWAATARGRGQFAQRSFPDVDSLEAYMRDMAGRRYDVYYATGAYGKRRTIDQCLAKKALYIDLDCGAGKPYPDQRALLRGLLEWCRDHFFAPSIIVSSGGGVHAYWTLDTALTLPEWQPLARQLEQHAVETGLHLDMHITPDAARILRMPGSLNFKEPTPRAVQVLHSSPRDYSAEEVRGKLQVAAPIPLQLVASSALAALTGDDDLSHGVGPKDRPRSAARLIPLCAVFSNSLERGGAEVEGLPWTHQLTVLAYCTDGAEYVHPISRAHAAYRPATTDRKWAMALDKVGKVGPPRCDTFAGYFPKECAGCPYRGKITTPLQLGSDQPLPGDMPFPYKQDAQGVYFLTTKKDEEGKDVVIRQEVVRFAIDRFQVLEGAEVTMLAFDAKFPSAAESALIDYSSVMEKRSAVVELSRHHIPISDQQYPGFRNLMSSWTMQMKAAKLSRPLVPHLGWISADDQQGFAIANEIFWSDGAVGTNTHRSRNLVAMYTPAGVPDYWQAAADRLLCQGRHAVATLIYTAFAAPLMQFAAAPGVIMSFVSRESGSGKSTAMKVAQSVWGDPVLGVNALNDTPASVIHKIAYTNNLPAYWDEVRARQQAADFIRMIYSISQGKERSRLRADISMQHVGTWATMMVCASNESIADHAEQVVEDSESGRVRIFEFNVPVISGADTDPELWLAVNALRANFGWAGRQYAQFLAPRRAAVEALVARASTAIAKEIGAIQTDRFWVSAAACLLVGAALAHKAGLVPAPDAGLKPWLISQLQLQRGQAKAAYEGIDSRAATLVSEWANTHRDNLVVVGKLWRRGSPPPPGNVISIPQRGAILGVLAQDDNVLRIDYKHFQSWVYRERGDSPSQIIAQLMIDGAMETRAMLDAGLPGCTHQRMRCLDVQLPPDAP